MPKVPGSVTFDTAVSRNRRPEISPDEGVQFVEVDYVPIAVENDEKQAYLGVCQPSAVEPNYPSPTRFGGVMS